MKIIDKYNARVAAVNSLVCVGLDADHRKLPKQFEDQVEFNCWIIDQTHEYASAYKPNIAFYEARGAEGIRELKATIDYLREHHPEIVTICDAKRADIGSTNEGYVQAIFDWLGFDAVTLHPYLGREALKPFLDRADKGCIILCRTSNPGAGEFQDLEVAGEPVWSIVAETVCEQWNQHGNCMLVAGATYPDELKRIREIVGDMTLLVPGIGAQGGDVERIVKAGITRDERGLVINSARGIIFAENPAEAARNLRDEINKFRAVAKSAYDRSR